jgi:Protein of unknown function (DUF3224)
VVRTESLRTNRHDTGSTTARSVDEAALISGPYKPLCACVDRTKFVAPASEAGPNFLWHSGHRDGLGKEGAIAGRPAHDHWMNSPSSGRGSPVRALQILRDDKSANLVSVQRFRGKLGGRQGTFVLQGSEIVQNGKIKARWFVVPRSGTGELSGLRGEGGFEGDFGKGSNGTLDYWFE